MNPPTSPKPSVATNRPSQETPSWSGKDAPSLLLQPGTKPLPEYELVRKLGEGGFGQVWLAQGPGGFEVALKFLKLGEAAGETEMKAMQMMKGIRHAHLLALFGVWEKDGWLIIAMELADCSLLDRLKEAVAAGLPGIPPEELLEYMREAAKGLDHLSEKGILHRDVKPHNLFLAGGSIKVADYGLAKVLQRTMATVSMKMTPAYAPPEIINGQGGKGSDQYSLAVTYCHLRANRLPFMGTVLAIVAGHVSKPPDLSMLPPTERPVVAKALAKNALERWPSCKAFVEAIAQALIRGKQPPPAPAGPSPPAPSMGKGNTQRRPPVPPSPGIPVSPDKRSSKTMPVLPRPPLPQLGQANSPLLKWVVVGCIGLVVLCLVVVVALLAGYRDWQTNEQAGRTPSQSARPPEKGDKPLEKNPEPNGPPDKKVPPPENKPDEKQPGDKRIPPDGGNPAEKKPEGNQQPFVIPDKRIGATFTNSIGMTFAYIPTGEFRMGSSLDENFRQDHTHVHQVRITKEFFLGIHEVSQEQYEKVMGANPSQHNGFKLPVENVTWEEAQEFTRKLNNLEKGTGRAYRLPTEAEWEYGCRAGTSTRFHFGDDEARLSQYAWYSSNAGMESHPIGLKKANAWGLFDMHGNVREWCQDWYDKDFYKLSKANDPMNEDLSAFRVVRGGCWRWNEKSCYSAYRSEKKPNLPDNETGFRVVCEFAAGKPGEKKPDGDRRLPSPVQDSRIGTTFTNTIGMTLTYIPAGEFLMGSPESEKGRIEGEYQHRVRLTRPFHLGIHEVTQEHYEKVIGRNLSHFKGANLPVETVSWFDCIEFCNKLSEREGKKPCYRLRDEERYSNGSIHRAVVLRLKDGNGYRLPSEAEWEYACRAGTTTPFHYGDSLDATQANFDGDYPYGKGEMRVYRRKTTPVGIFAPNAFGLFDMHGNVAECCEDYYDSDYLKNSPLDNPICEEPPFRSQNKVFRGGHWGSKGSECRSASRDSLLPDYGGRWSGFRVVLVVAPKNP